MSTTSEEEWKTALTEILEDLDGSQYKKMMLFLSDIPKHVRTDKSREEMPQVIIEHYGVETSVHKIHEVMDQIPRRDAKVQGRLRPFVERLEKKQEDERRGEQKSCQPVGVKSSSSALKRSLRQMSTTSEEEWKTALTEILEDLDGSQYKKMMFFLSDIPKHVRTDKSREEMPQVIIEHYGVETSVLKIHEVMDQIPRRDAKVQGRLRPFVERLEKKQEDERRDAGSSTGATGVRALTDGQKHFVDEHRLDLIQRVSNIEPILDELLQGKIIQQEAYDKIRAQQTPQERMRALYNGPLKAGDASKEAFYQSLKKHEPMLVDDLS